MQVLFGMLSMMLLLSPSAHAVEDWEICLDKGDFSYDVDPTLLDASTTSVKKHECKMTFAISGGKGKKYELDVCDPNIHINAFASLLESAPRRIDAGSAGCPAPLFGADFDAKAKDLGEYKEAREQVYKIFDQIKEAYGSDRDAHGVARLNKAKQPITYLNVDLQDRENFDETWAAAKIRCADMLLREYLKNCMSFEPKKPELPPMSTKSNTPGIHDQTILRK